MLAVSSIDSDTPNVSHDLGPACLLRCKGYNPPIRSQNELYCCYLAYGCYLRAIEMLTTTPADRNKRKRPEEERERASNRARRLAETHWDTRDDLRKSGKVELAYDTEVYWCRKLDTPPSH